MTLSVKVWGVAIGSLDEGESEAVSPETTGKNVTARFVVWFATTFAVVVPIESGLLEPFGTL